MGNHMECIELNAELSGRIGELKAERDALAAQLADMTAAAHLSQVANKRLADELADAKADHLRRHNDAVDRYDEIIVLKARVQALEAALRNVRGYVQGPQRDWIDNALKPTQSSPAATLETTGEQP